jgi:hypothetical protein
MKVKKQKSYRNNTLVVCAIALVVTQICFIAALWLNNKSIDSVNKNLSLVSLRQLDSSFGEIQPVVDAANKRLYLPGLNLYLPLTTDTLDLKYRVTDATGGGTADLVFMSKSNIEVDMSEEADSGCLDLVRVEIGGSRPQARPGESAQEPFRLDNGKLVYSYLPEDASKCSKSIIVTSEQIEPLVRQLHSY